MFAYIVRRVLATIPVMAFVALFVFSLLYIAPGDPAAVIAGDQATPEDVERIRASLGLDRPFLIRFGEWVWRILQGDLGVSIFTNLPVSTMIQQRIEPTLSLMIITLILAVSVAIPMGVIAAWKQGTVVDRTVMGFAVLGFSVPVFVVGYVLAYVFALELDWVPVQGYTPIKQGFFPWFQNLILPAVALGQRGGAAQHPVPACVEERCRADRDRDWHRHCAADWRRGGDGKRLRHSGPWAPDGGCNFAARLPGHSGRRAAVFLCLCAGKSVD